ncbi:MAG TPA: hypothetical protein VEA78_05660 [Acidimicrobiales bacterium]|nr:hypothetical protein [Acidimicrobiales bacterium]
MSPIERINRIARRQYGLVTHQQCIDAGMPPASIHDQLRARRWRAERPGVYVVGGVPPSWEQSACAVTLGLEDCWLSHGTAARLWQLPNVPALGGIDVLRPYGRFRRLDGVVAHRSRVITPADVARHKRIPVTSIGRTIVDTSGLLTLDQVGKNLDEAIRRNERNLELTRAAFARVASGGRRRLRFVKVVLGKRLPGYDPGESDLEITALRAIVRAGLPMPVQQHRVVLRGKRRRIDLAYPELKIAIELAGWRWHQGRQSFDDDKARANELVADGWRVLEFTSAHSAQELVRLVAATRAVAA